MLLQGGVVFATESTCTVTNSSFADNTADKYVPSSVFAKGNAADLPLLLFSSSSLDT